MVTELILCTFAIHLFFDMAKTLRVFSLIVISLFTLSIFGWMSFHISKGDKEFGFLTKPIEFMYSFPDMFSKSVEDVKTFALPKTFIKTSPDFVSINKLESDLIVLTAYSDTNNSRTVALVNLKNDSIIYKWTFSNPILDHERIFHPLLLPEKNLIYSYNGKSLTRIDSMLNVVWDQNTIWPHHSKNLDSHGNIWLSTYDTVYYATGLYKINGRSVFFKDEYIVKVDGESGEILFQKSMAEILSENNLSNYLLKSGDIWDPIHTNDVEPALITTPYYKRDDVFISAKNLSVILHYRPATNELINVIEGPFLCQHDVDFYDSNSLVFFNNNYYSVSNNDYKPSPNDSVKLQFAGDLYSEIIRYDFNNQSFSFVEDSIIKANKIFTMTEGLIDFYEPNTCFIEQQNSGVLWVIKDDEVIYKNVMKSFHKGFHHLPNWTRIIKDYE